MAILSWGKRREFRCAHQVPQLRLRVGYSGEDLAVGQRLAQLVGPLVGHLRVGPFEPRQLLQTEEVLDPGVGDWSASQVQELQVDQRFELRQPGVGDLGVVEVQLRRLRLSDRNNRWLSVLFCPPGTPPRIPPFKVGKIGQMRPNRPTTETTFQ